MPGESGNPAGSSRRVRSSALLRRQISAGGLEHDLALVLVAMALGRPELAGIQKASPPDLACWKAVAGLVDQAEDLDEIVRRLEALDARPDG
jgi:hypothetical protein